jgi:hypothetical protein
MRLIVCAIFICAAVSVGRAAQAGGIVNVSNFGAMPNDGKDDTAAIAKAIAHVAKIGASRLRFQRGVYDLNAGANPASAGTLMSFAGVANLTIEGSGAELRCHGLAQCMTFDHCRKVTVKDLSIDWDRPPFSVGRVIAGTERSFDVEVRPEYPVSGGEPIGAFMDYDPETLAPKGRVLDVYNCVEKTALLRSQVLRVHLKWPVTVRPGTVLVLRHQVYGYNALTFNRCEDVRARNVTVYTTPGMGLVAVHSRNVSVDRLTVAPRPGSSRPMSATADATHFMGCKGLVSLRNCVFEGMGDDGANIKSGLYLTVRKRVDEHTVLAAHNLKMTDLPDPGDEMEVSHPDTLLPYTTLQVQRAVLEDAEGIHRVTFDEPLPVNLREGDVLGNASRAPRLRMTGCTVRLNRARGVLCQTRDAVIEKCTFDRCTGPGVMVLTEIVYFHESIGTRDVTVRDNRFINCNEGAASSNAPLMAMAWLKDYALPPLPGVHRNVRLIGNSIQGADGPAIFAAGVEGLTVQKNVFSDICRRPPTPEDACAIRVIHCSGVNVEDNDAVPSRQGPAYRGEVHETP